MAATQKYRRKIFGMFISHLFSGKFPKHLL